jgi:CRISPR-associated protein Cas5/DevS
MLFVHFKAPFGAFRIFQSVEMAVTADFVTHSAAYGLLLGLAGIIRDDKKKYLGARIALGVKGDTLPLRGRLYQQLHRVKGGVEEPTNRKAFERSKGTKPDIRPYIREFLHGLEGYIGLDCPEHLELEELVRRGVVQPETLNNWGLPFLGDNNFFIERLNVKEPSACRWFSSYKGGLLSPGERLHYLSVWTDYESNSRSSSLPFVLTDVSQSPPKDAWIEIKEFNPKGLT